MRGFGGAGAFSDGKYNFTTEFGGWLNEYITDAEVMDLIYYVDQINMKFGATDQVFSTRSAPALELQKKALQNDLHLLNADVKHLGTENNLVILTRMYEWIRERVTLLCNTAIEHIHEMDGGYCLETSAGERYETELFLIHISEKLF